MPVTNSGTNRFHGQAFWYDRSTDWGAINPFQKHLVNGVLVPFLPVDKRHQFGGGIGGPIIKDKLFFFFSADQATPPLPGRGQLGQSRRHICSLSPAETSTLTTRTVLPGNTAAVNALLRCRRL